MRIRLGDRERIDVGAHGEHRSGLRTNEARDDARRRGTRDLAARHVGEDLVERVRDELCRALLVEGELRVAVQVTAPDDDLVSDRLGSCAIERERQRSNAPESVNSGKLLVLSQNRIASHRPDVSRACRVRVRCTSASNLQYV